MTISRAITKNVMQWGILKKQVGELKWNSEYFKYTVRKVENSLFRSFGGK